MVTVFPVLAPLRIRLKTELIDYRAMAAGVDFTGMPHAEFTVTLLNFWRRLKQKLPAWYAAARHVIAMAPSSASTERVFSQMRLMFGDRQHNLLQDLIEGGLSLPIL